MLLTGYTTVAAATPIRQLTNIPATNVRPAWSPDGARIAFQSNENGPYHVFVMNADGSEVRELTTGDADDRHPAWSPDGKRIAVDSGDDRRREIWVIDVATKERTRLTDLGAIASFPSWSPTGDRIAFYLYQTGVMNVWTMGADGGSPAAMTRELASERNQQCTFACHSVAWSPDGGQLAFSDGTHQRVLLMAALAASEPEVISPAGERSHFAEFLADGRLVYVSEFITLEQSYTDLWSVRPGTTDHREPVAENVQAQGPFAFRPDGLELLFASPRSGNFQIYAVTLDEAGKAALAERPRSAREFVTGPVSDQQSQTAATGPVLPEGWPFLAGLGAVAALFAGAELWFRRRRSRAG